MRFTFTGELFPWHSDKTTWVFVALPEEVSDAIDDAMGESGTPSRGFGSVKVEVELGASVWSTSLFPSKEMATYILPLKKPVRRAEKVDVGDTASFAVTLVEVGSPTGPDC